MISCNECNKVLIPNEDLKQHVGFQIVRAGYIYKCASLFSKKPEHANLYFCSTPCQQKFFDREIPKNEKVSKALSEVRKNIPAMAKKTADEVTAFIKVLKQIQNGKANRNKE